MKTMTRKTGERKAVYNRKITGIVLLASALIPLVGATILQGTETVGLRLMLIIVGTVLLLLGVFFMYSTSSFE